MKNFEIKVDTTEWDNALKKLDEALAKTIKTAERKQKYLKKRLFNF